ncbi:glycosyltransferase family protein [Deinococcus sp. PEB2-63]
MKTVKIFLSQGAINEVTFHYVEIIRNALKKNGFFCEDISNVRQIKRNDIVVTILPSDAFKAIFLKKARVIHWFQGIGPEEYVILHKDDKNPIKLNIIVRILKYLEKYILNRAIKRIYVSEAMALHYEEKYKVVDNNYVTVPCYNAYIGWDYNVDRYNIPSFIYVGSSYAWQKLDLTLDIFKAVQDILPSAKILIMTKDTDEANTKIEHRSIRNASVNYVSPSELHNIMLNFKYAFLIRDDIDVNHVATPTKMANYISSGLIPIYSDVIDAFKANINLYEFGIPLHSELKISEVAERIVKHHKMTSIDIEKMREIHSYIFNNYYSDLVNIEKMRKYFFNI